MLNRMAIWTENLKVFCLIVFIVSILMVYSKYFLIFGKSAPRAFIYKSTNIHHFSNTSSCFRTPFKMISFLNAISAAIFSFLRFVSNKFFITKKTSIFCVPFVSKRLIIALPRTISCRFFSKKNNMEFRITNLASNIYTLVLGFVMKRTRPRTEFKCRFPIFGNHYSFVAMQTIARCSHAIIQG